MAVTVVKPVGEQVVVVTGASSGIGREAALRFAERGARVALAARNQDALVDVAGRIERMGGDALPIPTDVADWGQMQRLAAATVDRFGRIDTWVNNAAVAIYGVFEDIAMAEFRRLIDVNLMGQVHGAKAALPHLRASQGTLIGVTSSVGRLPVPLLSAYGAAKGGLTAFYRALRLEQEHAQSGVRVSVVVPAGVDTPFYEHARSYLGVEPRPVPPVYTPQLVADAILYVAEHPVREFDVGTGMAVGLALERVAPRVVEAALQRVAYTGQRSDRPKAPAGPTNLWQPMPGAGAARGGLRAIGFDAYTWLQMRPQAKAVASALALTALVLPLAGASIMLRRAGRHLLSLRG